MVLSFIKHFKKKMTLMVAVGLVASLMEAIGITLFIPILEGINHQNTSSAPFPMNVITEYFMTYSLAQRLRIVSVLLIGVILLKNVFIYWSGVLSTALEAEGTNFQIRKCYVNLLGSESEFFHSLKGSYIYTIMRQHVGRFGHLLRMIGEATPPVFTSLILLVMLLLVSWQMTLLAGAFALISSVLIQVLQKKAIQTGQAIAMANQGVDETTLDTIYGFKTIKTFVREKSALEKFEGAIQEWGRCLVNVAKVTVATRPVFEITSVVGLSVVLFVGSYIFLQPGQNVLRLEMLLMFLLIFFRLLPPVVQLNKARVGISSIIPICHEVDKFVAASAEHQFQDGNSPFDSLKEGIEFKNVTFSYENNDRAKVLEQISIKIAKGAKVGIVGSSGAGKSTLAELLLRFYDPQQGDVLIDGVPLRDLDIATWRKQIGVVSQDTFLFNDTIKANILFSSPDASQAEVEQAARRAHIHDFILTLPKGYDTVVGDRGVLFSGGQKQRISIARAILKDPQVLIFDEATSALDTESEQIVQNAFDEVSQGKTVIAIAHRLSTLADSDIIFVLDQGRIFEKGTHQELLTNKGVYHKLVQMQALEK